MSRSLWKGIYTNLRLFLIKKDYYGRPIFTTQRNSSILSKQKTYFFKIYNGSKYISKVINDSLLTHKLGEFAITTQMGSRIHKEQLKKKLKLKLTKKKIKK